MQDYNFRTGYGSYNDGGWSGFMNSYNIGGFDGGGSKPTRYFSWSITFNTYGRQRFWTAVDDYGYCWISGFSGTQFQLGGYNGQSLRTTKDYIPPGTYTITMSSVNAGSGPWGIAATWAGVNPEPPSISSFTLNGTSEPIEPTDGIPRYKTFGTWQFSSWIYDGWPTVTIESPGLSDQTYLSNSSSGFVDGLPQSESGGTSPASRDYRLKVCNAHGCDYSDYLTVEVYNDTTPTTSWSTLFTNLESNTPTARELGTLQGTDIACIVNSPDTTGLSYAFSKGDGSWKSNLILAPGEKLYLRLTTSYFNTDVTDGSGNPLTTLYGNTISVTLPVTVGTQTFNVEYETKPPVIGQDVDFGATTNYFPYPDVDSVANITSEFIPSNIKIPSELDLVKEDKAIEIRSDNPDVQVRIGTGSWKYVKEIE